MKKATIQLETLTCPSCTQKVEGAVKRIDGIDEDSIKVLFNSSRVRLEFDEEKTTISEIEEAINKVGYDVESSKVR